MGLSHLIQRSITKKLLPSKPSNIISSSWFLDDTTAKSFDLSGGSNGAKINSFDDNDSLKISKSSYHVSSGGFMRGVVFWEPNKPVTIEEFQMPRPKAGEVLIKTKACGVCHSDLHVIKGEIPFPSPCAIGHEITGEVVEHGKLSDRKTIERFPVGSRVVGAFIMPCGNCFYCSKGHDDLCEDFFAYNRSKGTLYDGETRLFLRNSGNELLFLILLSSFNAHKLSVFLFRLKKLAACCDAPNTTFISHNMRTRQSSLFTLFPVNIKEDAT